MSKNTEQLTTLALTALSQGEDVQASVRVNYNGTVQPNSVSTSQSLFSIRPDDHGKSTTPDPNATIAFPSAKQMGLVLTPSRIMIWALGISGKPKQYLGEVPLLAIRAAKTGETRFGSVVRFVMKSGAIVDLEIMKGEPADEFIGTVRTLIGDETSADDDAVELLDDEPETDDDAIELIDDDAVELLDDEPETDDDAIELIDDDDLSSE